VTLRNGDERGAGLTQQPDNAWSDIGEEEQRARDKALRRENKVAASMNMLIRTRARDIRDEPPPPDLQRSQDAIRDAETRSCWAQWHRGQAARHKATLEGLISHHESAADRLEGRMV